MDLKEVLRRRVNEDGESRTGRALKSSAMLPEAEG